MSKNENKNTNQLTCKPLVDLDRPGCAREAREARIRRDVGETWVCGDGVVQGGSGGGGRFAAVGDMRATLASSGLALAGLELGSHR